MLVNIERGSRELIINRNPPTGEVKPHCPLSVFDQGRTLSDGISGPFKAPFHTGWLVGWLVGWMVGTRGKVSEKTLRAYLKRTKLNDKTIYRIQKTLTRGAMVQVTKMTEVRRGALKLMALAESSSQSRLNTTVESEQGDHLQLGRARSD
jgi:hypothetical protein